MSRQHAIAALVFAALAVGFTWPLALNLGRAVAEPGDAYLVIWILDWDWWATLHQPLGLFHANMLYPAKYTLAFTENLYGIALLLFPFRAVGVGPIVAYNLALIAGLALAGFGAYLLGHRLTRSFEAGLAAGIFFTFARLNFTHLQHIWSGWLPLMLVALLDYAERPSRKRAAIFAALLLINGLTNIHYFLFGTFAIAVTALLLMRPRRELAIAVAVALLLLAPVLYPYAAFAKLYNLQRTYGESVGFSATPSDWIASKAAEPERHVAPGALALLVAAAAFVLARREWPKLVLATLWIAIGFAGSLGMNFEFHRFLFGAVPGFRAIRVPARWSVIAYVGIAILIALTTSRIHRRFRWIVPLAFAVALWQAPIRWYMLRPQFPEVYRWLATTRGPIAELPMGNYAEYEYHLYSTSHHLPSVNGSAGTPLRRKLNDQWSQTPLPDDFLDTLLGTGVEHLILHADLLGARSPDVREWLNREVARGRLFFVNDFANGAEGDWVFSLRGTPAPLPQHAARFLAGAQACSRSIFGVLETPLPRRYARGLEVKGWSISPHGIRSAAVYFNNRTIRYPLPITRARGTRCWYYPLECHAHYKLAFAQRPEGVWHDTDVQVDVTDAKGNVWTSDNRWFRWE